MVPKSPKYLIWFSTVHVACNKSGHSLVFQFILLEFVVAIFVSMCLLFHFDNEFYRAPIEKKFCDPNLGPDPAFEKHCTRYFKCGSQREDSNYTTDFEVFL